MPRRRRSDPKADTLREHGTFNPHPERVQDEHFDAREFFDSRDLLQVKYEMIRRVQVKGLSVARAAQTFGFSRPSFYAARAAFQKSGLRGLLPRKRGPRTGHKLTEEVLQFIEKARTEDPALTASALVPRLKERFDVEVHPRSIERALAREKKTR